MAEPSMFERICHNACFLAKILPAAIMCSSGLSFREYERTDGHIWIVVLAILAASSGISAILYRTALQRENFNRHALILAIFSSARLTPYAGTEMPSSHQLETVFKDYVMLITCWAAAVALSTYVPPRGEYATDLNPEDDTSGGPWPQGTPSLAITLDKDPELFSHRWDVLYTNSVSLNHTGPDPNPKSLSSGSGSIITLTGAQQNDTDRAARIEKTIEDCEELGRTQVFRNHHPCG